MDGKEEVEADQLITQLSFFIIYLILFVSSSSSSSNKPQPIERETVTCEPKGPTGKTVSRISYI
jgi:hypothetical protein